LAPGDVAGGGTRNLYALFISKLENPSRFPTGQEYLIHRKPFAQLIQPPTDSTVIRMAAVLDFLMIAYGVGFFVIAILYVLACEKM
jgi:hypothetical protein